MKTHKRLYIYDCFNTVLYIDEAVSKNWYKSISSLLKLEEIVVKNLRRQSELTVSKRSTIGEYTFQDMLYNFWQRYEMIMSFRNAVSFDVFAERAVQEEVADLHRVTFANSELRNEITNNKKNGIPSFILSDFYLGREYLYALLEEKLGGNTLFDNIIVSCDINANKSSGTAYAYLVDKYRIVPQECLMTGDNFRSDYYNAHRAGFEVRLWKRKQVR